MKVKWLLENRFVPRVGNPAKNSILIIYDIEYAKQLCELKYCEEFKHKKLEAN